jgi:TonB family protein
MVSPTEQSGDKLLWLAAGVVATMGLTWLVVDAPWSTNEPGDLDAIPIAVGETKSGPAEPISPIGTPSRSDPLYMARMALDAGMLTEPPNYSAWSLFGRVLDSDPGNSEAREGLEQVALALLRRAESAMEQGRFDDAAQIAQTIAGRLPENSGAIELSDAVRLATEPVAPPQPRQSETVVEESAPVDPVQDLHDAFRSAMAQNLVLRPSGSSAIDRVLEMTAIAPDHDLTIADRDLLVTELLDRSVQSIEALDTQAAQTWIDAAAMIAADQSRIDRAQDRLTEFLIEAESQKILPASELTARSAISPEFPRNALERGLEGWVEIGFTLSPSGETENVAIIDASHERYFREEAIAAVDQWQFEPVMFLGRAIPKQSYTRLEFVLD